MQHPRTAIQIMALNSFGLNKGKEKCFHVPINLLTTWTCALQTLKKQTKTPPASQE